MKLRSKRGLKKRILLGSHMKIIEKLDYYLRMDPDAKLTYNIVCLAANLLHTSHQMIRPAGILMVCLWFLCL